MTLGHEMPGWGLGGKISLNVAEGQGVGWSSAIDTVGGVTTNKACPYLSSPESDFFFGPPALSR